LRKGGEGSCLAKARRGEKHAKGSIQKSLNQIESPGKKIEEERKGRNELEASSESGEAHFSY
jgi:hypothetical protein